MREMGGLRKAMPRDLCHFPDWRGKSGRSLAAFRILEQRRNISKCAGQTALTICFGTNNRIYDSFLYVPCGLFNLR